jgi:hypothetical protein
VVEYPLPTSGSQPSGISADGWYVWIAEGASGKISRMVRDAVLTVGVGASGTWDTEFSFANPNSSSDNLYIGLFPEPQTLCFGSCLAQTGLVVPARGIGSLKASQFMGGVGSLHVRGELEENPSTVTARVFNTGRPSQGIEIPTIRLSTLWNLNPSILAFPGANKGSAVHTNLVVGEVGWDDGIDIIVEAFSAEGARLGGVPYNIGAGGTLFLVDALAQIGVSELVGGQIRVTRTGGNGLMWGLLATLTDEGGVTVSPGMNP